MLEISISQIAFKSSLGNCQVNVVMKCGEKRDILKVQTSSTQKIIKYAVPQQFHFEQKDSRYLQFFIETADDCGYVKLLGSTKFVINEIVGKESSYRIELEYSNVLTILMKCMSENDGYKRNSIKQQSQQWSRSLRQESSQIQQKQRYGSPQNGRLKSKSPPRMVKLLDSGNLSKSSASSIKQQKVLEECKQFLQCNVLDESEEFQQSPDHRNEAPQPLDLTRLEKDQNQKKKSKNQFDNQNYKQMGKELSLLLDVEMDCDQIVHAVQQLLQQYRSQGELLIKGQCEIQILNNQLNSLMEQKQILEIKNEDVRSQIKMKLHTYKCLFEENVQLKHTLKEDLQKIVELNIQIKELKQDQQEKEQLDIEINKLKTGIEKIEQDVEQHCLDYQILDEEIKLIQYSQI